MKNLKVRFAFFSLLAMIAVSVFMTSCQQGEDIIKDTDTTDFEISYTQQEGNTKIMLPEDITKKGEEAVKEYLENMSDEQKVGHINDYIIYDYFTKKGKLSEAHTELQGIGAYRDLDLSKHLSEEELKELNESLIDANDLQIDSRYWCCYDVYVYSYSYFQNYYCWNGSHWYWCGSGWVDVYVYAYTVCYWC